MGDSLLEIFIDVPKDESEVKVRSQIERMCQNGWTKFGNNGFVMLFKDMPLDEGKEEMRYLGIEGLELEEWSEN